MQRVFDRLKLRSAPKVQIVDSEGQIPEQDREAFQAAKGEGSQAEAYYKDGRMVVLRDGAEAAAKARGISLEDRLHQLALHEAVHHLRSLRALFPEDRQVDYDRMVNGVVEHMRRNSPTDLAEITRSKAQGGYGYDLKTPQGRAMAAEEYLARFNEGYQRAPGAVQRAVAWIRSAVRRLKPELQWSDDDLRDLLHSATQRTTTGSGSGGVRFSHWSSWRADDSYSIPRQLSEWDQRHGLSEESDPSYDFELNILDVQADRDRSTLEQWAGDRDQSPQQNPIKTKTAMLAKEDALRHMRAQGLYADPITGEYSAGDGVIYRVPGVDTESGRPYIGSSDDLEVRTKTAKDGRNRKDADRIGAYPVGDREARRWAEQQGIEDNGGISQLDNRRNEIRKSKYDKNR